MVLDVLELVELVLVVDGRATLLDVVAGRDVEVDVLLVVVVGAQASAWHVDEQQSPLVRLPSSHCSPLSTTRLPHTGVSTVRQLAPWTDGAMRSDTVPPNTRSTFESPPVRWQ